MAGDGRDLKSRLTAGPADPQGLHVGPRLGLRGGQYLGVLVGAKQPASGREADDRPPGLGHARFQWLAHQRCHSDPPGPQSRNELTLGSSYILEGPQKLEVDWIHVGDDAHVGLRNGRQCRNLPQPAHPHLHNDCLGVRLYLK